jgi:hypothetical protein
MFQTIKCEHEKDESVLKTWSIAKMLEWIYQHGDFVLVERLYSLVSVLPVSSASCERNFSGLKIVKTRLRSSIGEDFLDPVLFLYMEKELCLQLTNDPVKVDKVIDYFRDINLTTEKKGKRRRIL